MRRGFAFTAAKGWLWFIAVLGFLLAFASLMGVFAGRGAIEGAGWLGAGVFLVIAFATPVALFAVLRRVR